ncbi:MAG: PAS domain S-box protein, partial [Deltaproteobacteria bacterium]|nr:PAS domain S-box protein [Deltaproteobacteria bacterium]
MGYRWILLALIALVFCDSVIPDLAQGSQEAPAGVSLTGEERAWLRAHPVIRVVQDPGWPTIEFVDERGKPSGMAEDYLKLIEERVGVRFERVKNLSWQEAYARLKKWEIDFTTSVAVTPERTGFWTFTRPYMEIPIVIAAKSDVTYIAGMKNLAGKKVAVVDGYAVSDWIPRDFPGIRLVKVRNAKEGLDLLQQGDVFAYIDNMLVVSYYLAKLKMANVKIAGETPYVNAQSMAVRKDWPVLAGILQKALDSISETERDEIYRKWMPIRYEHGFDYRMLWRALAVFAVILLGLLYWNRKLSGEIRSRKEVEAALTESETRFRQLFEAAPTPLCFANRDGVLVEFNDRFVQTFGYTRDDMPTQKEWWRLAYPDPDYRRQVYERWGAAVNRAIGNKTEIEPGEYRVTCKNGEVRTVVISGVILGDIFLGVFFDITERKRAETILQASESKYRLLVENANDGIFIVQDGVIKFPNPVTERVTGYSAEELSRIPFLDLVHPDDRDVVGERVRRRFLGEDVPGRYSFRIINKTGEESWVQLSAAMIVWEESPAILNVVSDVTQQRKLESQLFTAQRMESVGVLAGGIAHDFNNALTGIIGFAEILKLRVANDPKALSDVDEILRGADRAAMLTRQLLTFARRQIVELANLDLNRVVADLEKLLRKVMRADIEIRTSLADGLPAIRADRGQVEQVLMNLGLNARDAMPEGGRLVIETREEWLDEEYAKRHPYIKEGRYAVLSVSDTGIGMDEKIRERVFEPFFTTKEPDKGTGLGLAVVYGIVKQHNGFIHVYSEPGRGSIFRVYFPAIDAPADRKPLPSREIIRGGDETILLAEDDESVRQLAERTLTSRGYSVLIACNGEEAVETYRRHDKEIAMAVLDVVMPKKGGKQAYDEIITTAPGLKVLFLSGYSVD